MNLNPNRRYNTIALYIIAVFTICLVIYRFLFIWEDSVKVITNFVSIMAPFIIALFLAYFISPMVNFFEKRVLSRIRFRGKTIRSTKMLRLLAMFICFNIVLGTTIFLLAIIIPQLIDSIAEIAERMPAYVDSLVRWAQEAQITIGEDIYFFNMELINSYVSEELLQNVQTITDMVNRFAPEILNFTKGIASGILNIILGFIIAIYLVYHKESYLKNTGKILQASLPVHRSESLFETLKTSHRIFSNFFVGKMIDSLIIGLMCFVIMLIAKIPYAMLISVIVGVTNMIPYFGPFIGGGVGIVFLLISAPMKALWFAVVIIGLQQFDGNILGPKILGDSTGLTPFWVIFSIILFGSMFGLLGMFIGVPCFAVIKNIFDRIIDRRYNARMHFPSEPEDENLSL